MNLIQNQQEGEIDQAHNDENPPRIEESRPKTVGTSPALSSAPARGSYDNPNYRPQSSSGSSSSTLVSRSANTTVVEAEIHHDEPQRSDTPRPENQAELQAPNIQIFTVPNEFKANEAMAQDQSSAGRSPNVLGKLSKAIRKRTTSRRISEIPPREKMERKCKKQVDYKKQMN